MTHTNQFFFFDFRTRRYHFLLYEKSSIFPKEMGHEQNTVGIIGGGQLALMLLEPAQRLALTTYSYCPNADDPVARTHPAQTVVGTLEESEKLIPFINKCDVVTFENEFIDVHQLAPGLRAKFVPETHTMKRLQNKTSQKELLSSLKVKHAAFQRVTIDTPHKEIASKVLKWAQFGYDGYGTLLLSPATPPAQIHQFFNLAHAKKTQVFAEERIDFSHELAMVFCAQAQSRTVHSYPLTITEQLQGICKKAYGPATEFSIPRYIEDEAREIGARIAQELKYTGVFAVEFFLTKKMQLLVNEIAPRVHNSGHYSMAACQVSQFENHLRAITDRPVTAPKLNSRYYGMLNLLGDKQMPFGLQQPFLNHPFLKNPNATLTWYNKIESRKKRKLGHVNILADTADELNQLFAQAQEMEIQCLHSVSA